MDQTCQKCFVRHRECQKNSLNQIRTEGFSPGGEGLGGQKGVQSQAKDFKFPKFFQFSHFSLTLKGGLWGPKGVKVFFYQT